MYPQVFGRRAEVSLEFLAAACLHCSSHKRMGKPHLPRSSGPCGFHRCAGFKFKNISEEKLINSWKIYGASLLIIHREFPPDRGN